jgi:hypothetical protein
VAVAFHDPLFPPGLNVVELLSSDSEEDCAADQLMP